MLQYGRSGKNAGQVLSVHGIAYRRAGRRDIVLDVVKFSDVVILTEWEGCRQVGEYKFANPKEAHDYLGDLWYTGWSHKPGGDDPVTWSF